jgi:hypothetical protein
MLGWEKKKQELKTRREEKPRQTLQKSHLLALEQRKYKYIHISSLNSHVKNRIQ